MSGNDLAKQLSRVTFILAELERKVSKIDTALKHLSIRVDYLVQAGLDQDTETLVSQAEGLINEIESIRRTSQEQAQREVDSGSNESE